MSASHDEGVEPHQAIILFVKIKTYSLIPYALPPVFTPSQRLLVTPTQLMRQKPNKPFILHVTQINVLGLPSHKNYTNRYKSYEKTTMFLFLAWGHHVTKYYEVRSTRNSQKSVGESGRWAGGVGDKKILIVLPISDEKMFDWNKILFTSRGWCLQRDGKF